MFTELKLAASDPQPSSRFGRSVAIDGDHLIIGRGEPFSLNAGAAYIFVRDGASWVEQAKLTNADAASFDAYGSAVAIDGDIAVVGASGAANHGKVYLYHRRGSSWVEEAQLAPSNPGSLPSAFGTAVSISGTTLVVGTKAAAFVFRRSAAGWTEEAMLSDGAIEQTFFGSAVGVDGNSIVVGAPGSSVAGAVHLFVHSGSSWVQEVRLEPPNPAGESGFGGSVSIHGNYVITGGAGATSDADGTGAAYIFERDGSAWVLAAQLAPPQARKAMRFGRAVSVTNTILGAYAVVGDPADYEGSAISGAAYLYKRVGTLWSLIEPKIKADDSKVNAEFGCAVHISGDSILIGASSHTDSEYAQGVAYVITGFTALDSSIDVDKWAIYAVILFGIIGDGGGVIVLPGGGGGPIDPEPYRQWITMTPAKRDVYLSLMIRDMASLVDDERARKQIKDAATALRKLAVEKLPEMRGHGQSTQGTSKDEDG